MIEDNNYFDTYVKDTIWYKDLSIILAKNRLTEFYPSLKMNIEEKLNAIVRLCLYLSIILLLYSKKYYYLFVFLISLLITYLIHKTVSQEKNFKNNKENFKNKSSYQHNYVEPTINNPFMNVELNDYYGNQNRESIIKTKLNNNELKKKIEDTFNYNLYRDFDDIFSKNNSQRQFYTTPITTIPNDQTTFSKWLYKSPPTCKEGNLERCYNINYNNLKQNSY